MNAPLVKKMSLAAIDKATYNPRAITPEAMRGLRESLGTYGMLEMPVVNVSTESPER